MLSVREAVDEALQILGCHVNIKCLGAWKRISRRAGVDLLVILLVFHARVALVVVLLLVLRAGQYKLENKQNITMASGKHTNGISAVGTSPASGDVGAGGDLVEEPSRGLFGDFGLAIAMARLRIMDVGANGRNR